MPIKSIQVKDYMSGSLITFTPDMDVRDAIHELVKHRIAGAPVVDSHGTLVGMLSEFDCLNVILKAAYHEHPGGPVSELMTSTIRLFAPFGPATAWRQASSSASGAVRMETAGLLPPVDSTQPASVARAAMPITVLCR